MFLCLQKFHSPPTQTDRQIRQALRDHDLETTSCLCSHSNVLFLCGFCQDLFFISNVRWCFTQSNEIRQGLCNLYNRSVPSWFAICYTGKHTPFCQNIVASIQSGYLMIEYRHFHSSLNHTRQQQCLFHSLSRCSRHHSH